MTPSRRCLLLALATTLLSLSCITVRVYVQPRRIALAYERAWSAYCESRDNELRTLELYYWNLPDTGTVWQRAESLDRVRLRECYGIWQ